MLRFNASTLQRFIRDFCSAALIGVAALSLAACGSGGGESTDPAGLSKVKQREEEVASRETAVSQKESQQQARDRRQDARKEELDDREEELNNRPPRVVTRTVTVTRPAPAQPAEITHWAGLTATQTAYAGGALKMAATSFPLYSKTRNGDTDTSSTPDVPRHTQMVTWDYEPNTLDTSGGSPQGTFVVENFVLSNGRPSVNAGQINYAIDFSTSNKVLTKDGDDGELPYRSYIGVGRGVSTQYRLDSVERSDYITRSNIDLGFGSGWDSQSIKARSKAITNSAVDTDPLADSAVDATLYTEIWSNYSSTNTEYYLLGGIWLLMPDKVEDFADARMGALGQVAKRYGPIRNTVEGTATYSGSMAGLHMTENTNAVPTIKRLLGSVTLTADFGTASEYGSIEGRITNLKLDGNSVTGSIVLPNSPFGSGSVGFGFGPIQPSFKSKETVGLGTIDGVNYQGRWQGVFGGPTNTENTLQPSGIAGTVGGTATNKSFIAAFGAQKTE